MFFSSPSRRTQNANHTVLEGLTKPECDFFRQFPHLLSKDIPYMIVWFRFKCTVPSKHSVNNIYSCYCYYKVDDRTYQLEQMRSFVMAGYSLVMLVSQGGTLDSTFSAPRKSWCSGRLSLLIIVLRLSWLKTNTKHTNKKSVSVGLKILAVRWK